MCEYLNMEKKNNFKTLIIGNKIMALIVGNQLISALIIGGVVGLVAVILFPNNDFEPPYTTSQVMSATPGQSLTIEWVGASRNENGIVIVTVRGSVDEYEGKLTVAVRTKDDLEWFEHDANDRYWSQTDENGNFMVNIQFGSNECPIKGGEKYVLRISSGEDSATATVTLGKE